MMMAMNDDDDGCEYNDDDDVDDDDYDDDVGDNDDDYGDSDIDGDDDDDADDDESSSHAQRTEPVFMLGYVDHQQPTTNRMYPDPYRCTRKTVHQHLHNKTSIGRLRDCICTADLHVAAVNPLPRCITKNMNGNVQCIW